MKIEWLNTECTKARLRTGWFRRRYALVYKNSKDNNWGYSIDTQEVSAELRRKLNNARRWQPAAKLPEAKIVQP